MSRNGPNRDLLDQCMDDAQEMLKTIHWSSKRRAAWRGEMLAAIERARHTQRDGTYYARSLSVGELERLMVEQESADK